MKKTKKAKPEREFLDVILDNLIHEFKEKMKYSKKMPDIELSREFFCLLLGDKTEEQKSKILQLKGIQYVINYSQLNPYKFI